ncbi:facilitated trehalose transporter Tret1-like isoform X1 [Homalodisca vitripennis]|uniref:facilitated trehalose transporter Tret1-like isoform X1 n=1 Tax=Homalodisca vitripennis TaxID=197043 RepID=UPI001EEA4B67|nr:facilitated trehalose transporter Tret1-like isoform X1 [Homalodisca vitripennis]
MDYHALIEILACLSSASLHFGSGIVVGFGAILVPQLEHSESEIKVSTEDISWIVSIVPLMVPLGSILTGYLVDKIGRLNTLRASTIPYVTGWICIALAHNFTVLLVGRMLTGFSLGLACNPSVVYISEVARPQYRSTLICMAVSLASLGIIVVYTKGAYLDWRFISWTSISYCILPLLFMFLLCPESPAWLISKGRTEKALKSLTYLHQRARKTGLAEQRLEELVQEHRRKQRQANQTGSGFGVFRGFIKPTGYKPALLLSAVFTFQQFTGIYITIYYSVSFLKTVGTSVDPYISTVAVGLVRLVMGILTSVLLNKFGRRTLFMVSGVGMSIFIFISGYYTKEITQGHMEKNVVPVICIMIYISVGVIGFMSIPWTMTAELFPIEIRGVAQSLMMSYVNLVTFGVLKVYPFMDKMVGSYGVQWLFSGCTLVATMFIFVFLPETRNKTLSEIQDYFENNTIYLLHKQNPTNRTDVMETGGESVKLREPV